MINNEDFKIEVLSSISEDYIDEVTAERINAKKRVAKKRKTFTALAGAVAAILIFLGAALPIIMLGAKQVPVYTGMTVSSEYPLASASTYSQKNTILCAGLATKAPALFTKPLKDAAKDHFGIIDTNELYYANPGDEVYITVTFDNPDDFVILSFTLNGKSYSSYMFEEGSDMENIVLKVKIGDVTGLISYTIDAIKYVDGEKIKDVRIGGDRTVNIGVYNENQPTASISELNFKSDSVIFDASVTDEAALISAVGGKVYAVIYDGDRIVSQREITVDSSHSISFDGLEPLTEYSAAIVAVFDAYDGNKTAPHVLCEEKFTTRVSAFAKNIVVNGNDVSFELFCANDSVSVTKVELVDALGEVIAESYTPITEFKDIPGGRLYIRVSYSYMSDGVMCEDTTEASFICSAGMLPMIGKISAHYDSGVVLLPPPISTYYSGHFGVDIVPTTENTEVYSITDGVITDLVKTVYQPEQFNFVCGKVEILDENGVYHYYKFLNTADLAVGDEVKAGDVLGTLCEPRENDMTIDAHLHYACYTRDGNGKTYIVPEFDPEPRLISEQERLEKIALSENMLISGSLNVSGVQGSTVTYTTSFDLTYDDDKVVLNVMGQSEYVTLEKLDNGQYNIICSFENITEPVEVKLNYLITVSYNTVNYCDYIILTLTPTAAP